MFDALPESRPRRRSRRGGIVGSVAAHGFVLGTLIHATAQRNPAMPISEPPAPRVVYIDPARVSQPPVVAPGRGGAPFQLASPFSKISVPKVDVPIEQHAPRTPTQNGHDIWWTLPWPSNSSSRTPASASQPFSALEVDRAAEARPGAPAPQYPAILEAAGIGGAVRVQFVVDTTGRADVRGIRVVAADDSAFAAAVRAAIGHTRYRPAELGGHAVNQLVEQAFTFRIAGR